MTVTIATKPTIVTKPAVVAAASPRRGVMRALTDTKLEPWVKTVIAGKPKSAGKTTLALSGPGKKLHLAYDLGKPPRGIPGVDESQIWTVQYEPSLQDIKLTSDQWGRPSNVGEQIFGDIQAIRNAFVQNQSVIEFADGARCPLPDMIVMDGMTEMSLNVVDWILSVNRKTDPKEFDDNFYAWRKRLDITRGLLHMILPLPCHVALIAWESPEVRKNEQTGKVLPDLGGKMDELLPGRTEMAVRCYGSYVNGKVRHMVQVKPDGIREWVGVRGRYDDIKEIDVTIERGKPVPGPWERVFGAVGMYVRPEV